jgi:hypothetical protein
MSLGIEILLALVVVASTAWLLRRLLRPRAPAEPADDPLALVGAPLKPKPRPRAGAVALQEPEDIDPSSPRPRPPHL